MTTHSKASGYTHNAVILVVCLLYACQTWLVKDNAFFWDTIQFGSLHAHWYFDHHFSHILLPDRWDSGHPPLFGMYVALCWIFFGKTLAVSHLVMLPWIWLAIWNMAALSRQFFEGWSWLASMLVLLVCPVWAAQSTLVSPDIIVGAAFWGAVYAIWRERRLAATLYMVLLCMVSNRGLIIAVALIPAGVFFFEGALQHRAWVRRALIFLPGIALAITYQLLHWWLKGWAGYFEGSSWHESFQWVDTQGLLRNAGVLAWRLVDLGHLPLWILLLSSAWWYRKNPAWLNDRRLRFAIWVFIPLLCLLAGTVLPYTGLLGHRYFMPIYWMTGLLSCLSIAILFPQKMKIAGWLIAGLSLLTGHVWVYPQPIATGWDCTLAHLPWFAGRDSAIRYMKNHDIPFEATGTAFPNLIGTHYTDLSQDTFQLAAKDLRANRYILYSNVMNDFTGSELDALRSEWKTIYAYRKGFVRVILYQK